MLVHFLNRSGYPSRKLFHDDITYQASHLFLSRMESFIAVDKEKLASSVAQVMIEDKVMSPVCLSERTINKESDFCHYFYDQFQQQRPTPNLDSNNVVHIINISTPETMDIEFERVLATLHSRQYVADAYVTFSEYAFQMINNVSRPIILSFKI